MSTKGYDEKRTQRQIKSARLKSIKTRNRSRSPSPPPVRQEKSRTPAPENESRKEIADKNKTVMSSLAPSKLEKTRRMTQTYMGPITADVTQLLSSVTLTKPKPKVQIKGREDSSSKMNSSVGVTPSTKKYHLKKVMDKERKRAVEYRNAIGRRNACDFGKPSRQRKSADIGIGPRSKSVQDDKEKSTPNGVEVDQRCKSSLETPTSLRTTSEEFDASALASKTGLTTLQIKAFYEVFDLFDSNGGGTIDADELDEALRSVNITLTRQEIYSVLSTIDNDGNGEIDFTEFLLLMTNTERFIEALTKNEQESAGRETLLFAALTEFMKKAALHSMDEIVGYYSHKYKKAEIPHVVNHYAAGARLIGLTERQLKQHLEHLKASNAANGGVALKSPYAAPLHILNSNTNLHALSKLAKTRKRGRIKLFIKLQDDEPIYQENGAGGHGEGEGKHMDTMGNRSRGSQYFHVQRQVQLAQKQFGRLDHIPVRRRGFGWVNERAEHIDVQLPSIYLRKLMPFSGLTAEDLPAIRTNVSAATECYNKTRLQAVLQDNFKHWKALEVGFISPKKLQSTFRDVYSVYSQVGKRHLKIPQI